jgi:ubiquinone/menaquinone biosynthesis C-methylase UbiE
VTPSGYEDAGPFQARLAIYAWQRDPVDLPGLAVAALDGVSGVVLDVGCGPGRYTDRVTVERPDLHVASVDLSPGMRPRIVADAGRLPFADAAAGAALAMHMLYHVPDMRAAVAELRRVVRPGGVVLVSSNRADNVPEAARPGRRRPGGSRRDRTVSSRCRRPRRCRPG